MSAITAKTGITRTSLYRHLPPRPPAPLTAAGTPAAPAREPVFGDGDGDPTAGPDPDVDRDDDPDVTAEARSGPSASDAGGDGSA